MGKIVKNIVIGYGGEPSEYYVSVNTKDVPTLVNSKNESKLYIKELHCIDYPNAYGMKAKITKFDVKQPDGHISKFNDRSYEFSVRDDIINKQNFELAKKDLPAGDPEHLNYNKENIINQKLINACEKIIHPKK